MSAFSVFGVPEGDVVTLSGNISADGASLGERVTYTAVATNIYAHVNGEPFPRRKFVDVFPAIHGSREIWLADTDDDGRPVRQAAGKEAQWVWLS